jgi:hypothetical protein
MNTPGHTLLVLTLLEGGSGGGGSGSVSCQAGNVVTFAPNTSQDLIFPNPLTTYAARHNLCLDPSQVDVQHWSKSPVRLWVAAPTLQTQLDNGFYTYVVS